MNKLSTERAIEALYTVRAYYASLTAGYPKGKDCKGIDDVTCSEIANSCLMAIKALEQEPCEDCISRQAVLNTLFYKSDNNCEVVLNKELQDRIKALPHVTPTHKEWIPVPEGATNKDMFKTVFGYEPATDAVVCNKEDWCGASKPCNYCFANINRVNEPNAIIGREEDWWNAPYKAESEE